LENSTEKTELINSFSPATVSKDKKKRCPICRKKMGKTFVSSEEDIVLDECKNGHGLWFDKGEILEVIKRGSINEANKIIQILEDMYKSKIQRKR
ncbi:MAG: zf-TFIIB domain-containing protein, partial [Melioribacteraceae bacterium]|nr:zf-TFIIB domain-containing protein [Melioribacteraceae bacterium]